LFSNVSASTVPTSIPLGVSLELSVEDYHPIPPAAVNILLAELPERDSSNITLQSEIFELILNSGMMAAGFILLSKRLEAQFVAAALKHKENEEKEKIRVRVEDTVDLIVDYATENIPYPYDWAEQDAKAERREQDFLNGIFPPTPSSTGELGVSVSTTTLTTADVNCDREVPTVACSVVALVPPTVSLPTNVVVKAPKHPINARVSQSHSLWT